jgi:hypothetical protein
VSQELQEIENRFGELIQDDEYDRGQLLITVSQSDRRSHSAKCQEKAQDEANPVITCFGTAQEIRSLRKRVTNANS